MISNELEVILPIDLSEITLPDPSLRKLEKDYYDEYIEVGESESATGRPIRLRKSATSSAS